MKPPNTVAYWSCQPPLRFKTILSAWKASSEISYKSSLISLKLLNAPIIALAKTAEPPRPEPGGTSLYVVRLKPKSGSRLKITDLIKESSVDCLQNTRDDYKINQLFLMINWQILLYLVFLVLVLLNNVYHT